MVARLNRRAQFAHLRAHATTEGAGRLRVSVAPWDTSIGPAETAVAFAVPRSFGTAVDRNRVRRRLREVVRAVESDGGLPQEWLLVAVVPSQREPTQDELMAWFTTALARVERRRSASERAASGTTDAGNNRAADATVTR